MNEWVVYILECSDGSYYTGITKDINKRLNKHNKGIASKYTRTKLPVKLLYSTNKLFSLSEALKIELKIKKIKKEKKLTELKQLDIDK